MIFRGLVLSCLLSAAALSSALAQSSGTFEIGAFARRHFFGESYGLTHQWGGGGRIGVFLVRNLAIEVDGSYLSTGLTEGDDVLISPTDGAPVSLFALHGRLLYNIQLGGNSAIVVGGGSTYHTYGRQGDGDENGPGALAGLRLGLSDRVTLRADGTIDYMGSPNDELSVADDDWHYGVQAGLSLLLGGRRGADAGDGAGDRDRDGVTDDSDQCPDTPRGTVVDALGCPRDTAAEADSVARAAEDSARAAMQMREDSLARMRADSVARAEAERMAADSARTAEEARVQAFRDSLQAATEAEAARRAELEAELASTRNRARQAAIRDSLRQAALRDSLRTLISERNTRLTLQGVNFATGTATLTESSRFILEEVARSLQASPEVRVEVAGHTDNTGSRALNERLSLERAESVKAFLVEQGVDESKMETAGYAFDRPVAPNTTREGRARNRRTDLTRID